jgi:hypothetical protein
MEIIKNLTRKDLLLLNAHGILLKPRMKIKKNGYRINPLISINGT